MKKILAVGFLALFFGCQKPVEVADDPSVTTVRVRSTLNSPPPNWVRGPLPEPTDEEIFFRGVKTGAAALEQGQAAAREDARKQAAAGLPAWGRTGDALARGLQEAGSYWERAETRRGDKVLDVRYDVYLLLKFDASEFPQKEAAHLRGLKELSRGNLGDAVAQFEKAIGLDPGFADAWHSLAQAREKLAEEAAARPAARREHERRALDAYAQFLALSPSGDRATAATGQVLRLRKAMCAELREAAKASLSAGRPQEALDALAEAYRLAAGDGVREAICRQYYEAAGARVLQGVSVPLASLIKGLPAGGTLPVAVRPFAATGGGATREGEMMQQALVAGLVGLDRVAVMESSAAAERERPRAVITGSVGQNITVRLTDAKSEALLALVSVYHLGPVGAGAGSAPVATEPAGGVLHEAPIELETAIFAQRRAGRSVEEIIVNEGAALRSRDQFQVRFRASREAYAYVIIFDSAGKAGQLFPDAQIRMANKVQGGAWHTVPDGDRWFWLDDNPGTETIYVVASVRPLENVSGLLAEMERAGADARTALAQAARMKGLLENLERGVGGITEGARQTWNLPGGRKLEQVTEVVKGRGSAVRVVSFEHK